MKRTGVCAPGCQGKKRYIAVLRTGLLPVRHYRRLLGERYEQNGDTRRREARETTLSATGTHLLVPHEFLARARDTGRVHFHINLSISPTDTKATNTANHDGWPARYHFHPRPDPPHHLHPTLKKGSKISCLLIARYWCSLSLRASSLFTSTRRSEKESKKNDRDLTYLPWMD